MREILFRGKRTKTGEWVSGLIWHHTEKASSIYSDELDKHVWVHPETVGQFTGLTDKNGKKIFEGDIIEWFAQGESEHPDFGYIEYDEQSFAWRVCWQKYDPDWLEGMQSQYITVIGNIFDNKDLLS